MGKFTDYQSATHLSGTETMLLAQNGKIVTATLDMLRAASPNSAGVYPDVPLNRVTIKRNVPQASTIVVMDDNLSMVEKIRSLCYPCLVDRNSKVAAYLNGDDTTVLPHRLATIRYRRWFISEDFIISMSTMPHTTSRRRACRSILSRGISTCAAASSR